MRRLPVTSKKNWTEDELIVAFNLYCKLPFGQYHKNNPKVIELARLLNRTPSAVSLKLCNFARLDPYHKKRGIKGMEHGSKLEEIVWNQFNQDWDGLAYKSETILANLKGASLTEIEKAAYPTEIPEGKETEAVVKIRINQNFFRTMVLANYRNRCCVCLLSFRDLLVAGHIIPWAVEPKLRTNPRNGICMCALHDRAFDKGLITIDDGYRLIVSESVRKLKNEPAIEKNFIFYDGNKIRLPDKFPPDPRFLEYHRNNIFVG